MLKFPFLYVGFKKTMKNIFKLVGEKKCGREKTGSFKLLDPSTPWLYLTEMKKIRLFEYFTSAI